MYLRMLRLTGVMLLSVRMWYGTTPVARADDAQDLEKVETRYNTEIAAGHYKDAEASARQMLAIIEKTFADQPDFVSSALNYLAIACQNQGRYAEAEPLYKRALALELKSFGPDHAETAQTLTNLALMYENQDKYAQAEPLLKQALSILKNQLKPNDPTLAYGLSNLSNLYVGEGRYAEAESLEMQALQIREKVYGVNHAEVAASLLGMASLREKQGKYAEAESLSNRALKIQETAFGQNDVNLTPTLNILAFVYFREGKYAVAEPLYNRALAIQENALGPADLAVANTLYNQAKLFMAQGKYAEAEMLLKRALGIFVQARGPDHISVAMSLNNLAGLYLEQGKYAAVEPLYQRALQIEEKAFGSDQTVMAFSLSGLAEVYHLQGRLAEAEPLYERALAIREKLGPDHLYVAWSLEALAGLYSDQRKYAAAVPLYQRASAIKEKAFGSENVDVAKTLNALGNLLQSQGHYTESERLCRQALAIQEKVLKPDHPAIADSLHSLASLFAAQGKYTAAEPVVDRAIDILERAKVDPGGQYQCYVLRAQLGWQAGRRDEAAADLRRAMDLAEQIRTEGSGSGKERAQLFSSYSAAFELMLQWQVDLNNPSEALAAMERGRARSLLDELNAAGHDLNAGRSAAERKTMQQSESELRSQIVALEKQLEGTQDKSTRQKLETELASARQARYDQHRDQRNTSPVFRNLLSVGAGPLRLSQLQRSLAGNGGLVLLYWLGEKDSYLLAITGDQAQLHKLTVDESTANALGRKAGSITAVGFKDILTAKDKTGVLQQLSSSQHVDLPSVKLHALWQMLVPEELRQDIVDGKYKRLVVVPDGALALLPFETLVVEPAENPVYLLDRGPPILYGPSATVLYKLGQTPLGQANQNRSVLTVGDPVYDISGGNAKPAADQQSAATDNAALASHVPRSRYSAVGGGRLSPLPYSGTEVSWVADAFSQAGIRVTMLLKGDATKTKLCDSIAGRTVIHLACHGKADQQYGNFYGALALTPGPQSTVHPTDDGFLTLAEICDLDLKGCELAILSACDTNYGPEQRGEGVLALSRGFLVAGSRRVVASNWLVDDEAAASLVSVFCQYVAQGQKAGQVDYAEALYKAKQWVRKQDKWQRPYYWGTFVLVGPK